MAAECYELVISGNLAGQFVQNVMHINVNNVGNVNPYVEAQDILDTLNDTVDFSTLWANVLPTDYHATSWRCRRVLATGGPTAILLAGALASPDGERPGTISSAQANPVMVFLTDTLPNKPGRVFLPGVSEDDIDEMVYVAALVTAIETLGDAIAANFTLDGSADPANFSVYRRNSSASHDITHTRLSPLIGTQRRRLHPV